MPDAGELERLIRAIDDLEGRVAGYVTREQVEDLVGRSVETEIADDVLLVDHRTRLDGQPVTLCRLNRYHPTVQRVTAW